jgi:amino acid adenylation domain-containing protein
MINYPLSSNQKSIWNTQKIFPNSSIFSIGGYAVINESIDVNIFKRVISDLTKTNEILATNINDDIEYCTQNVDLNFIKDKMEYLDYSAEGISAMSLCKEWMDKDIKIPFELDGPLFKTVLFKIDNEKYCWYLKIHHIIADGYSFALLFNKLSAIYNSRLSKTKLENETADNIKLNFFDFVTEETSYTNSFRYKDDKDYWMKMVENIPVTKTAVNESNFNSKRKEIIVQRTKFNEMANLCKEYNIQPLHCLISVFHILYSKISKNDHLIIGIPVLNRNNVSFKNMVGPFFNILPMLFKYSQNRSFIDIGKLVKSNLISAYRHQKFPINDLIELLDHKGSLYDVMFSYQKVYYNQFIESNTEINFLHNSEMFYDLAIHLLEYDEEKDLKLLFDYRTEAVNEYEIISLIEGMNSFIENFDALVKSKRSARSISDSLYSETIPNRDYWKSKLSKDIPKITISQDFPPTTALTYKSDSIQFSLAKSIQKEIERFNSIHHSSLLTTVLASIKVLLYKYTGEKDITVGIPIQTESDLGEQIGPYLNILPLRDELDEKESFISLLWKVSQTMVDANNHQVYPIDFMIKDLGILSHKGASDLFDLLLIVHDNKIAKKKSSYVKEEITISEQLDKKNKAYLSKNDIIINLLESDTVLQFDIEYNANLYLKEKIQGFGEHLKRILEQVLKDAHTSIDNIDILNEREKRRINKYSAPEAVFEIKDTVIEKFSEQVAKTPGQIAVMFEDKKLTYQDLDTQSDQVSYYLRKKITEKREYMVGLILERSEQLAVIILGILKAGCAYVAIDNGLPKERKKYILEDSGCKIVITEAQYASEMEEYWKGNLISFEDIPSVNTILPRLKSNPEDCAFVIYTSGSTGVPKGILQTHKCLLNVVIRQVEYGGFEKNLNILQYSSISFDVFIAHELFFALLSGGCLHIISENQRKDLNALGKYIVEREVEWVLLPVSALNTIVEVSDELWQKNIKLKHIVSAGEQLNLGKKLISYLVNHPAIRLHNFYGPSETHNASNYTLLDTQHIGIEQPIGRPSVNTWIHILSENNQLVPIGIPGELYISGASLAKGYINRPDMTSERFIPNPYLNNELMYKTGDIGKWLPDGNIKFLGRKDDQVKIRGYRVELGEIENALLKHPKVKQCAVIAPMDKFGRELRGYIVSEEGVLTSELRAFLLKSLPEYMVPGHYINLKKLPLNTNGKIDRKSLPSMEGVDLSSEELYVAPRNALEEKLVKIWEEVLKREKIGVRDDFFTLGGHSLKAMKLLMEYNKTFEVRLSLQDIFFKTQLFSHAELIDIRNWVKANSEQEVFIKEDIETFNF